MITKKFKSLILSVLLSVFAIVLVGGTISFNADANNSAGERLEYSGVKYRVSQVASSNVYFNDSRKGLKLFAYDSGAKATIRGSFSGEFETEVKASTKDKTKPELSAYTFIFESQTSEDKFSLTVEDSGAYTTSYVSIGEEKTGAHYGSDGKLMGYTTIKNDASVYTKITNTGTTKIRFNPQNMGVYMTDATGKEVAVWILSQEVMDGKYFPYVLSPMDVYTVSVEFTKVVVNGVGELVIYSINGEDFSSSTLPATKPLLHVNQTTNAVAGNEYELPNPSVFDNEGTLSAKDVEYVVYDKDENVLSQGKYGEGASFTPSQKGNYYLWYKVTSGEGQTAEEYLRIKAYESSNVTVEYEEIEHFGGEYGLNSTIYIPTRSLWSNVFTNGYQAQMSVEIKKDGQTIEEKTTGGFEYKFTTLGEYEITYKAQIGNETYEKSENVTISSDVVGVSVGKLNEIYFFGETVTIPTATIYYKGQSAQATQTVVNPIGNRENTNAVNLDYIGKYTVEYAYSIAGKTGVISNEFNVEYRITDLFELSGKGSFDYDYTSGYAEAGVMFTANDASATLSYDVDLSSNTKDDVLIDFYVLSNEIGVSDIGGVYITLTDKLDPNNYVTVRCVDGSKNMDSGTYIKGRAYNQNAWTGYYKAPVFTSAPYSWTEKIEAAMNHNAGGFVSGHDFGPDINTQDFKEQTIKLCYDAEEKAIYANTRYELKPTETQRERLVVDFDDSALFTTLWGGFSDDSQVVMTISAFNLSATGKIKIVEVDGYKFNSESVVDIKAPTINVDMEGMTEVPCAKTGLPYNVFKTVNLDNFCASESLIEKVTVTYGNQNVEVTDGAFIPQQDGFYTITYAVSDAYGNTSTQRVEVESRSDITPVTLTLNESWAENVKYGDMVYYPDVTPNGGSGRYRYIAKVLCNGEEVESFDEYFIPLKSGEYEVLYTVEDYLGQSATVSKNYSIEFSTDIVVDAAKIIMPPAFIDGNPYVFDEYVVGYYPEEGAEKIAVTAKIEVIDANGTTVLGKDRKYTPKASDSVKQATVRFIFEGKTTTVVEKTAEIRKIEQKSGFVANYFVTENATLSTKNQFMVFETEEANKDLSATFIRPVGVEEFSIQFKMNDQNGVSRSNFDALEILLTDKSNSDIQVKFIIRKDGNGLSFSVNGGAKGYMPGSLTTASTQNIIVAYNNSSFVLTSADNTTIGMVTSTLNGKAFEGFTSNEVFVSFKLSGVKSSSAINLVQINNQRFFSSVRDTAQPQIYVYGSYSGMFTVATEITLPKASAYDVLNYTSSATLTVRTPSGGYLASVDGVVLNNAPADREYVIAPVELGRYTVAYSSTDVSGQTKENAREIVIYDNLPPEITLTEKIPERVLVGTEVKVPAYTLSDNGRVDMITVTVYYRGADGIMYPVENGKITVTEAGTYTICFYLVDENQNYTIECYDFVAVNK